MGSGFRTFTAGEVLTASNVQNFLQNQSVMVFADSTARATDIGTANFEEGMLSYLEDTDQLEVYNGTAWASIAPTTNQGLTLINTTSFSAVSAVNLPAATFSATYQNYRILFVFDNSTSISHTIRLRTGGVDASGANYNTKGLFSGTTGSVGNINTALGTSWYGFTGSSATTISLEVYRPFEATPTLGFGTHYANGTGDQRLSHFDHSLSTSYDALSLICSTGNITGTVRVYGYNQ
jgi:hypothetical protein